ncbi:phage tail tip lysozyme [Aquitalea denitrificans]|uniref:phage tail tip lysozyme n=1 Tax=Aquitalea denitrificans TaxID=519081 RepID=UPI001357C70F|nr:phage tail tip lysozyme [Aquitalea denitrificans]
MADENILKEFLVSLGFKVDPASESRFKDSVKSATDSMKEFSVAVAAAATETLIGINRMADNLGALHFQSQRVGASANNIKALQYAFQQVGGTAEDASSALETLATKFRESPGWEQKLNDMGIATRDSTGKALDNAETLLALGKKLAAMKDYEALAQGQKMGLSDRQVLALKSGELQKYYQEQIDLQEKTGSSWDKASDKAKAYDQEMNRLKATFSTFVASASGDLDEQLIPILKLTNEELTEFADWFHSLPEESQQTIKTIAEVSAGLALIVTNLKLIAAAKGVLGALGGAGGSGGAAAKGGIGLLGKAGWVGAAGWSGWEAGSEIYKNMSDQAKDAVGGTVATILAKFGNEDAQKALDINTGGGASSSVPIKRSKPAAPAGNMDVKSMAMAFFQKAGWTKEQASGLVANLMAESKLNPGAVGDSGTAFGIAQWHPDRQANFAKWSGKDIRQSTLQDQLAFVVHELTKGSEWRAGKMLRFADSAQRAGEIVSRYYERPGLTEEIRAREAASRGAAAAQIHQTTNITVNGTETPRETAQAVAGAQNDVNANLVRNSLPVVR